MRPALIAQVAATTALGALVSTFAALYVAQQTLDLRAGLLLRALLVTVVLLLATWFAVRPRLLSATRGQLRAGSLLGLLLGYLVAPGTWGGRTYAGQLVTEPGTTTLLVDLALWLLVGGAMALAASAPASAHQRATYAAR